MLVLDNAVRRYEWGAVDGLARLVGTAPTGGPEAELWVGDHPVAPSTVVGGATLDRAVVADPVGLLGAAAVDRHGARLPFLLKVLAIGAPLSIQLHPDGAQAAAGFAREEAAGVALDDPTRTYRDPHAKPEILVALRPTWALAGFRSGDDAADRLAEAGGAAADLAGSVAGRPDARDAFVALLRSDGDRRRALAEVAEATTGSGDDDDPATWVGRLAAAYPGDPTALAPLVLDLIRLEPGRAVFLPAGVPHAYLRGAGVELMAASDNVVRGGLTPKHVDVDELLALLAAPGAGVQRFAGEPDGPGLTRYAPPGVAIRLHHAVPPASGPCALPDGEGPALVLALGHPVTVTTGGTSVTAAPGRAVMIPAGERGGAIVDADAWVASADYR